MASISFYFSSGDKATRNALTEGCSGGGHQPKEWGEPQQSSSQDMVMGEPPAECALLGSVDARGEAMAGITVPHPDPEQ